MEQLLKDASVTKQLQSLSETMDATEQERQERGLEGILPRNGAICDCI